MAGEHVLCETIKDEIRIIHHCCLYKSLSLQLGTLSIRSVMFAYLNYGVKYINRVILYSQIQFSALK